MSWPKETLNGLKVGDNVRHKKHKHLCKGIIDDVTLKRTGVYISWFDENGRKFHWARYDQNAVEKI